MTPLTPARRASAANESGSIMMYILMMVGLVGLLTVGVLMFIAGDLTGSVRQVHAVRVFTIAEGGLQYAMAKLQTSGANMYAGETITYADGGTTLGTATVTVGCVTGVPLPCIGPYSAYRRIVSVGQLTTGGPSRTIVAVVEGFPQGMTGYAICAYISVLIHQGVMIYGDVGSNGTIDLQGPSGNYARIRNDPPPPYVNNGYYSGSATAVSTITCSQNCATQVMGTTTPYSTPPCPSVTPPAFTPGPTSQTVDPSGWTMDDTTGYDWDVITLNAAGTSGGCTGATPFTDLKIQTGAVGTTTVVNVRKLIMGRCSRLVVLGDGDLELRISEETDQGLFVGQWGRFGVLETDTGASPALVPAVRLMVWVRSASDAPPAMHFNRASVASGAFVVFNGTLHVDRAVGQTGFFLGAMLANRVDMDRDYIFVYDPTILFNETYGNFNLLRSWKDQ